ncbi:unnamed protein product [Alopecurus aequalis]
MLRSSILDRLLYSPATFPVSQLRRLLSAVAPPISPNPSFTVGDYLVGTCGLTPAEALKASTKLSHLKSPTNPDAVLAFLAGLGLSSADVAAVVAKDPELLCARVEYTLAPVVTGLAGLGLSRDETARLVPLARERIRCRSIVPKLQYYLPLFGSFDNLLRALKFNHSLLTHNLESTVKPNIAVLRECGLGDSDIGKLSVAVPRMLTSSLDRVREIVACAEGLGVPRGSLMFRHALHTASCLSQDKIAAKMDFLKKTFRWSDAEVAIVVSRAPSVLTKSEDVLQTKSGFLISELGLEPASIAHRPVILNLSLEGRLKPRYYVVNFLKENRLLDRNWSYYTIFKVTEKEFVEKIIGPHKEAAPHLAEDYAAARRGQVPTRFVFS